MLIVKFYQLLEGEKDLRHGNRKLKRKKKEFEQSKVSASSIHHRGTQLEAENQHIQNTLKASN